MEPLRNLLLAGLGALSYSQEKLKSTINLLIEKGELTRAQGEKVLSEWIERGKGEQEKIAQRISTEMQKVLSKLSLVSRDDYEALVERVERLEQRLDR